MMTMSTSREDNVRTKCEGSDNASTVPNGKYTKGASTTISSRQWSGFKNPRIVRVSRAFGGKDRHSKVCTIRGLRDRRIRLSVPTAIQLYDLQDRLGLSQPSKVVDWLLDATKLDIDKLPPLQIPLGSFEQLHQAMLESNYVPHQHHSSLAPFLDANLSIMKDDAPKRSKSSDEDDDMEFQGDRGGRDGNGVGGSFGGDQVSAQNFFPINGSNTNFLSGLLASNHMPYNYYHSWDPSSITLSQFGSIGTTMPSDHDRANNNDNGNNNGVQMISSSLLGAPTGSQLFLFPPSTLPQYVNTDQQQVDNDLRQNSVNFHQLSSSMSPALQSSSSAMKSFPFNMNPELHSSDQRNGKEENGS